MSRTLEDILFGDLGSRAQAVTRALSVTVAATLLVLVAGIGYQFHAAGQFEERLWEFFAWKTTWAFLGKGLLGTLASAAAAAVIALVLGLVLLVGRLSRLRLARWPAVAVIEFLRGVPTLLLIYVCFLVLPSVGIKLSAYWMLTLPVGLNPVRSNTKMSCIVMISPSIPVTSVMLVTRRAPSEKRDTWTIKLIADAT